MSLLASDGTLCHRLARMRRAAGTGSFTAEQREAFNEHYEKDPVPPWALFVLLVNKYRYITFYRTNRMDEEPFAAEPHILWNNVLLAFREALRQADVMSFRDLLPRALVQGRGTLSGPEELAEIVNRAREAIPPEVVTMLRLATYTPNPGGYVELWATSDSALEARYTQLREEAEAMVGGWFGKRSVVYGTRQPVPALVPEAWPETAPKLACEHVEHQGTLDEPLPQCAEGAASTEAEFDEFARLGRELVDATLEQMVAAMVDLSTRRGCGAVARFCMSVHGAALGLCSNQEVWQRLCEQQGWRTPRKVGDQEITPSRRVYPKGRAPRFALQLDSSSGETSVLELEPEYEVIPGEMRALYDWHAHYIDQCDKR